MRLISNEMAVALLVIGFVVALVVMQIRRDPPNQKGT